MKEKKNYKKSIFNYYMKQDESLVIYNTLNETLIKISDYSARNNDTELIQKLFQLGMIVEPQTNERQTGLFKYYKKIYSNSLNLIILTTGQCNFRCKYCYETFEKGNMTEKTKQGIIRYLQRNVTKYSSVNIDWFGGEPLVNLSAIREISPKIIELCKKAKIPYTAGMTTNGSLLTADVFEELLQYHVYSVQVTVDGLRDNHDRYRVYANNNAPSFDRIVNNLISIRDLKRIQRYPYKISIRSNITREGLATLEEYIQYMEYHFSNNTHFGFFFRPVGDWGGDRVNQIKDSILSDLSAMYEILQKHAEKLDYSPFLAILKGNLCYAGMNNHFVVDPDGELFKCTVAFDNPINHVGHLLPNGIMNINEGNLARWIVTENISEKCKECFAMSKCLNGTCPLSRIIGNQTTCGYEMNQLDATLTLIIKTMEEKGYDLEAGCKIKNY